MQKSIQKKMIVLKTDDSRCFEEVHLILKSNPEEDDNMVTEANRIIARAEAGRIYHKNKRKTSALGSRIVWFFAGMLTAIGIALVTVLLLSLVF